MERTTTWQTSTGKTVTVTAKLVTSKTVYADGDNVTVPCCERSLTAEVEGMGTVGYRLEMVKTSQVTASGLPIVAKIGKLGLTADNLAAVRAIEQEITDTPEWQAHLAGEAAREAGVARYNESRKGVCPKCGTYCYGDCEAN